MQLRLLPEALEHAREAVLILDSHGVELMTAAARLNVAWLALLSNQLDEAVADAELARESFRRQHRAWGLAWATLIDLEARLRLGAITRGDVSRASRSALALERAGMQAYAVDAYLIAGRAQSPPGGWPTPRGSGRGPMSSATGCPCSCASRARSQQRSARSNKAARIACGR